MPGRGLLPSQLVGSERVTIVGRKTMPSVQPPSREYTCLPPSPASLFLVGIGGIGMSALAQFMVSLGYRVAGSDRDLTSPGRRETLAFLEKQGIHIYPQDGEGVRTQRPAALIVSAAIEDGNPDLDAQPESPVIHRAAALDACIRQLGCYQIAIAGSCGKTSVTGWIASALRTLGHRVAVINGGYMLDTESRRPPGNFWMDPNPEFVVYEVDESDRSLLQFAPDCGVLLNIGTDHYERGELIKVFTSFLNNCRQAVVFPDDLAGELGSLQGCRTACFAGEPWGLQADLFTCTGYRAEAGGISFEVPGMGSVQARQFGRHSALNALAVLCTLSLATSSRPSDLCAALTAFQGIRQRFEYMGMLPGGQPIYCDYAHNVEKIAAAIRTAREATGGPVAALFQPHGYGPLGFMRNELGAMLGEVLEHGDTFQFLPVYYAGGTTSFSPTSEEVADEYSRRGLSVSSAPSRDAARGRLSALPDTFRAVLVMGARDPSLAEFARSLIVPADT